MRRNINIYLNSHLERRPSKISYLNKNINNNTIIFSIIYPDYNPWKDTYTNKLRLFN
jgi:hypothetical protein